MEECNVCGNEELITVKDGLQCSMCLTDFDLKVRSASKSNRKQKALKVGAQEKISLDSHFLQTDIEKNNSQSKLKAHLDWTTHEAFNVIIKKQVDCLIKRGANQKLQDTVCQLWFHYLYLSSIAFPDPDFHDDILGPVVPKHRDHCIANSKEGKSICRNRVGLFPQKRPHTKEAFLLPKRKHKKKKVKKVRESSSEEEMPLVLQQIKRTKIKLNEIENNSEDEMLGVVYKKRLSDLRNIIKMNASHISRHASKQVDYMDMPKTVAFCYLGILFVEDSILLSDIIRWIREGHFPYLEALNLLPTYMKPKSFDIRIFVRTKPPSCSQVREVAGKLAYFLGFKELPKPSLNVMSARFVMDLNLPSELNTFVKALMDYKPVKMIWGKNITKKRSLNIFERTAGLTIPDYEGRVMSLIIVALKLLFGLDDHTERKIASYAQRQSKLLPNGTKMFIWSEWVNYINLKMDILKAYDTTCAVSGCSDVIAVNDLHWFYRQDIFKRQQPITSEVPKKYCADGNSPIHALFIHLNNSKKLPTTPQQQKPTSFPMTQIDLLFRSQTLKEDCLLVQDFHNTSLQYITHPGSWKEVHKNFCKRKKLLLLSGDNVFSHSYNYWFYDMLVKDIKKSSLDMLPLSFQWLLQIVCHCIELKPTELYSNVLLTERMVLKCGKLSKLNHSRLEKQLW